MDQIAGKAKSLSPSVRIIGELPCRSRVDETEAKGCQERLLDRVACFGEDGRGVKG
jgi:hypothetical protein